MIFESRLVATARGRKPRSPARASLSLCGDGVWERDRCEALEETETETETESARAVGRETDSVPRPRKDIFERVSGPSTRSDPAPGTRLPPRYFPRSHGEKSCTARTATRSVSARADARERSTKRRRMEIRSYRKYITELPFQFFRFFRMIQENHRLVFPPDAFSKSRA